MKRIIITGATGLIGSHIAFKLIERGDRVTILSRSAEKAKQIIPGAAEYVSWNLNNSEWYSSLEEKDVVIHLAGESIMAKRWNARHKKNILSSRTEGTKAIVKAINSVSKKPKLFISASAIGYYGSSEESVDENSKPGNDFLANVVRAWENSSEELDKTVRKVIVRIGLVLDKNDGALARMIPAFKFFVGGPIGSGKQWFSWIHINDVVGIFQFAIDNEDVDGIFNAASPSPVKMKEFARTLGKVMHRPSMMKVPGVALRLILGEAADAVLGGVHVVPKRTIEAGYKFRFSALEDALENIFG
jgi:uncharacterized protein